MAAEKLDNVEMKHEQQATSEPNQNDVVSTDLPAPLGWSKKLIPKKSGTPRRSEIVFVAPTGEEIKNKRQLDQYLKSHSDGPSATEFDWGTGDTPRRSSRLSSKPIEAETPEIGSSRKKQKGSGSKKGEQKKEGTDEEAGSTDDEKAADDTEAHKDVKMNDVEVQGKDSEKNLVDESRSDDNPSVNYVDGAEGKADETPGDGEEKPVENKSEAGNSDVLLPQNDKGMDEQPSEIKSEKELAGAEIHPEAESAAPNIEIGVNDGAPANAETKNDGSGPGQEDPEKNAEVGPTTNGAEGNGEAADHTEQKPLNADTSAPESYLI